MQVNLLRGRDVGPSLLSLPPSLPPGPRSSGIYSSIELASPLSLKSHFTSVPHDESIAVLRSPSCGGAVFCIACAALRFDLQSGHTKCIAEDIKGNSTTVGKYSIVNPTEGHPLPESHKLTVRVTSATRNNYHSTEKVEAGQLAFTTAEAGDYMVCFLATDHKPEITMTVDFEWKSGVAARDWCMVAKKNKIEVMEFELKQLQETITSIHEEMLYLREREEEMQELNQATNVNMGRLSFLSLGVCFSCWIAVVALEDLLLEEEDHLKFFPGDIVCSTFIYIV